MSARSKMILFAAGIACGAAAGILLAPEKGEKTRKAISDKSRKLSDSVTGLYGDVMKKFERTTGVNGRPESKKNAMDKA